MGQRMRLDHVRAPALNTACPRNATLSLASLPTLLAIPPMNMLVAACAGAAFHRRRAGRVLLATGLVGLVVFGLPAVASCLMAILESGLAQPPAATGAGTPQAIVILSGDQQSVWVDGRLGWRVGAMTLEREAAGALLARQTHLPVLVSGGIVRDGAPSLADQMALSLQQDFLVPVRWREADSQDTWQNARDSAAILRAAGISRVYLVTHAWHMRRALVAFERAGLQAIPAPVVIHANLNLTASAFVPSAHAWQESYYAMHELIGWAWYAIKP